MMRKITIKNLEIFTPKIVKQNDSLTYEKELNDDFDIDNFLHFPILINEDGTIWKHGSLYLLSKLKKYIKPSPKTLDSIANDLKSFKEYCDEDNIDYLSAPRKILRPTYLYRSYLQELLREGKISPNTIKRKMSAIVGFYEYLIDEEKIQFKFPLWESGITSISYSDNYGFKHIKEIKTKDVSRVISTYNPHLYDEKIIDGGKLHPLSKAQQILIVKSLKKIGNIEMLLSFLISLTTGARIQTVFTLRKKHFERNISKEESTVKIKIGIGTDCDTKFDKLHVLFLPIWLFNKIKIYLNSERYKSRVNKSKHIFNDLNKQYIFLTNRGSPFYVSKHDPYRMLYKEIPNGAAVRQFIRTTLNNELLIQNYNINFSFHDLRATFGMNLLNSLTESIDSKDLKSFSNILITIKERMGHNNLTTTERYLKFKKENKIKESVQYEYEKFLEDLLNE